MGLRVLSLFDGMSCGMLAMMAAGISVERYDAYEIDKYAITTSKHNFPQIEQHGDVFEADFTAYKGYDFLIGGSPCTYWSIAQKPDKREVVASGLGWELFSQYVRALHEAKPKYFIYENNKSMSKQIRASIDDAFGFEAICINSALVSAQNRQRLYWVGVRNADGTYSRVNVEQPADRGILLKDVLDSAQAYPQNLASQFGEEKARTRIAEPACVASRGRYLNNPSDRTAGALTEQRYVAHEDGKTNTLTSVSKDNLIAEPQRIGTMPNAEGRQGGGQAMRIYSPNGKSTTLKANAGGGGGKTGLYAMQEKPQKDQRVYTVQDGMIEVNGKRYPIKLKDGRYIIRKLTVTECMRLQTVPEWYDFSCVSNIQAYKMLGNGWTVEVIAHLIRGVIASL